MYKIINLYIRFRTIKLRYMENIWLYLISKFNESILCLLFSLKMIIEDIRKVNINDEKTIITDIKNTKKSYMNIIWKWKFTGFDINDLYNDNETITYITKNDINYILYINGIDNKYRIYNIDKYEISDYNDIIFNILDFNIFN